MKLECKLQDLCLIVASFKANLQNLLALCSQDNAANIFLQKVRFSEG